jgi:hypothetical protein
MRQSIGSASFNVLGVDVGKWLNYVICKVGAAGELITLNWGKLEHFEELDTLIRQFRIRSAVVDIRPETRKAKELRDRCVKRGVNLWLAEYDTSGTIRDHVKHDDERLITLNRTEIMDDIVAGFKTQFIELPRDFEQDPEFIDQLKAPVRTQVRKSELEKRKGSDKPQFRYVETGADHYFHSYVYAKAASMIAPRQVSINAEIL